jgi:hypothetical protein
MRLHALHRLACLVVATTLVAGTGSCSDDAKPKGEENALAVAEASQAWMGGQRRPAPGATTTLSTTSPSTQEAFVPQPVRVELTARVEIEGKRPGEFVREWAPKVMAETGREKQALSGTPERGLLVVYTPGFMDEDGVVPIRVSMRKWAGGQEVEGRWVVRLEDGQTYTLRTAGSGGTRVTLFITMQVSSAGPAR